MRHPITKERETGRTSRIFITCAKGVVPYLKEEVLALGFPIHSETMAGVETEGTLRDTFRLNLHLRTGQRVLFLIEDLKARDPEDLYRGIVGLPWENYFSEEGYLSITSSVDNPTIRDSRFASQKCKDAIVDRFYKKVGRRPDSGPDRTGVVIHLYWKGETCRVFFDTSGEPLSRRGYRRNPGEAPMQETLAAAIILASGWKGTGHFINPMCGSGTLAIEAALIALNKAPGLLRNRYGFMHLKGYQEPLYEEVRKRARAAAASCLCGKIIATDIREEAVEWARRNAMTAGVEHWIEFGICNYNSTFVPEGEGVVFLNPPYGERLGEKRSLEKVYQGIGDFFKKRCRGYRGFIFTGNMDLSKKVGLRTGRRLPFFNGEIECRLLEYELYEGTRKHREPVSA